MFRVEAVEAQKQKLHGDVFLAQPLSFRMVAVVLILIIGLLVTLVVAGSYARTEHVVGHLVPTGGLVKLRASQFGRLESLAVREGDEVSAGEQLAAIRISQNTLEGGSAVERSIEALKRQRAMLDIQVALEQNQLKAEQSGLVSEKAETVATIVSLERRITLQGQITESAATSYQDVQELLEKGYISKVESERRRQTWLSQQAQAKMLEEEIGGARARLEQLEIRLTQLPNETEQRLARLNSQLAELEAREAELEGRSAYIVTSPVDGKVVAINSSSVGRSVGAQQHLFTILPKGSSLQAELFIPSRAVGFIEAGQEVKLLYDAFPYQRFGSYAATIEAVTETIFAPGELAVPFEFQEPVYRATAALSSNSIDLKNRSIELQSGMTLRANIVLERQSFLGWLLSPLTAMGARS